MLVCFALLLTRCNSGVLSGDNYERSPGQSVTTGAPADKSSLCAERRLQSKECGREELFGVNQMSALAVTWVDKSLLVWTMCRTHMSNHLVGVE